MKCGFESRFGSWRRWLWSDGRWGWQKWSDGRRAGLEGRGRERANLGGHSERAANWSCDIARPMRPDLALKASDITHQYRHADADRRGGRTAAAVLMSLADPLSSLDVLMLCAHNKQLAACSLQSVIGNAQLQTPSKHGRRLRHL